MKKYKFLGIAPYEGFKGYFQNSLKKHNNIDADIYSVSLDNAVELVNSLNLDKYDAVISRGRTGKMVKSVIDIPFVNVEFSGYDLLRALKQAQFSNKKKIAFVSFFDLASNVSALSELLELKTPIITATPPANIAEMKEIVSHLYYDENVTLFIGDGACMECVSLLGINTETILITSGEESMDKAFEEALEVVSYMQDAEKKNSFYLSLFEQSEVLISLFNSEKEIVFSNIFSSLESSELHNTLKRFVDKIFKEKEIKTILHTASNIWKIHGKYITIDDNTPYALFSIKNSFHIKEKTAFSFEIAEEKSTKEALTLISSSIVLKDTLKKVNNWSKTKLPILIYGGAGTGKKTFAMATYAINKYNSTPLITIDCGNLDTKNLSALFDDDRSPLYENDYTILFNNINLLNKELQNKLSYYISSTMLTSRNKVISTFTGDIESMISNNSFSNELYHKLAGIPIEMPYLHERAEDIPIICRAFLTSINQQAPIQIVGFEPEAMDLLKNHTWDYGVTQLNFLLKQLVTIIKGQLITTENISFLLSQTEIKPKQHDNIPYFDMSKTLDEISVDIIKYVLAEENNNQSAAASRLGISRSTLWKKLKE